MICGNNPTKFLSFILVVFVFVSCSHGPTPVRSIASSNELWGLDLNEVPDSDAIKRWSDPGYENANGIDLNQLERIEIPATCEDKRLYPTHPQQTTKVYHIYRVAVYNHQKLNANSDVCKISSKPSSPAVKKFCLNADSYHHVVISDMFEDGCGNYYRGVWRVGFLRRDESMGSLFSKGRTLYQNPKSEFENDLVVGSTYFLNRNDFLFLAPLYEEDLFRMKKIREDSLRYHRLDPQTNLFSPIN